MIPIDPIDCNMNLMKFRKKVSDIKIEIKIIFQSEKIDKITIHSIEMMLLLLVNNIITLLSVGLLTLEVIN